VSSQRRFAAVSRDASDGVIKFLSNITTKPTSTINFTEAGTSYSNIKVGSIQADSATIGDVDNTELQYLNGVTSAIQTQLNAKLASATASTTYAPIDGATLTGTVTLPATTSIGDVSATEMQYLSTVTSNVQTQLDAKLGTTAASSTYAPLTSAALVTPTINRGVLTSALETISVSNTQATGTVNVDLSTSSVKYYTGSSAANWTFNFRGNGSTTLDSIMSTGQSITVAFLATNGATPYYANAFTVDGFAVTPKWQGGAAPTGGNANSIDSYTFTLIKTGTGSFTVLAAQIKFA
jgi:hypothetical protein